MEYYLLIKMKFTCYVDEFRKHTTWNMSDEKKKANNVCLGLLEMSRINRLIEKVGKGYQEQEGEIGSRVQ